MCANEDAITNIQDCAATLNMANSTSTISKAKGIAHLTVSRNTGNIPSNLHNTLLVKDLRTNLISVSKITRNNDREVLFTKNEAIVRTLDGEIKLMADRIGDLYCQRGRRTSKSSDHGRFANFGCKFMACKARALAHGRRGEFVETPRVGNEIVIGKYVSV